MKQEEKARHYDLAIEKARQLCAYPTSKPFISDLQDLFPELAESEDKKMVKFIKQQLFNIKKTITENYELDAKLTKAIDWLEKQGKQNLANSAKTCKDEQNPNPCDGCVNRKGCINCENGELREVEQKPANNEMKEILRTEYEKGRADAIEEMQKEWSEEDENGLGDALWCCKQAASIAKDENDMGNVWFAKNWLKSLKERVQPQLKQEWSEEDEITRKALINLVEMYYGGCIDKTEKNRLLNFLKSLRPQNWKPSEEQMKALKEAVDEHFDIDGGALWHLYQELKNLKDEK